MKHMPIMDARAQEHLSTCAIAMVRNEADIIIPFLNHASHLFERIIIVDIQSTDGTTEAFKSFSNAWPTF